MFVDTRHSLEGFRALDALLAAPRSSNFAWASALVGPARCGKTTFVKRYLRSCRDGEQGRKPLSYLYVELKQDTKPSSISYETLKWMDDPHPGYGLRPSGRAGRKHDSSTQV